MSTIRQKRWVTFLVTVVVVLGLMVGTAFATTVNVTGVAISVTDSANTASESNGIVTVTVTGTSNLLSGGNTVTNNIQITNTSGQKMNISFDYSISNQTAFTIAGTSAASSGSYSGSIEAGGTIAISMSAKGGRLSSSTATLKLQNFSLVAPSEAKVTVEYDNGAGSVSIGGSSVTTGSVVNVGADGAISLSFMAE